MANSKPVILKLPADLAKGRGSAEIKSILGEIVCDDVPPRYSCKSASRVSFYASGPLLERLRSASAASGRALGDVAGAFLATAVEPVPEVVEAVEVEPEPEPDVRYEKIVMERGPRGRPTKYTTFMERVEKRLNLVRFDQKINRWAVFTITGGVASVEPDQHADGDFADEIAAGLVAQEIIPHEYSKEEREEWLRQKRAQGFPFIWSYVSGDCESINDLAEVRRRAAIRASDKFGSAVEAIAEVEREEALEREIYGRPTYYIGWSARDCARLKALGHTPPDNLTLIVKRAKAIGWVGPSRPSEGRLLLPASGGAQPPSPS
jgi:hypothetical protein